jgi:thymidine kinase
METLFPASKEQHEIVLSLHTNNVMVNAVAGSGKTTTILHISEHFKSEKILVITYNSKLKLETREKIQKYNLDNVEVHTFHSFCRKNYNSSCKSDTEIREIFHDEFVFKKNHNKVVFDIIILDEVQDMSPLYYKLFCKLFKDNNNLQTKIGMFGDFRQSIFSFNKSDERYITLYDKLFYNMNNFNWGERKLQTSFRITNQMSTFLNECMFDAEIIIANKHSEFKPRYLFCNGFDNMCTCKNPKIIDNTVYLEFKKIIDLGYLPKDIFILAPSIKSRNYYDTNNTDDECRCCQETKPPVLILENLIKKYMPHIPIYVPLSDEGKVDETIISNKVAFLSFHQSKGLERKVVFVFNFDNSYFTYYGKNLSQNKCPNTLYVATTRASERLILIHQCTNDFLPFLRKDKINHLCDPTYKRKIDQIRPFISNYSDEQKYDVTYLTSHLPEDILDKCFEMMDTTKGFLMKISSSVEGLYGNEIVCDINGIFFPTYYQHITTLKIDILYEMLNTPPEHIYLYEKTHNIKLSEIDVKNITIQELLFICVCYSSMRNKVLYKITQIKYLDWINDEHLQIAKERLDALNIHNNSKYEFPLTEVCVDKHIAGRIDLNDFGNNTIYKFKCVTELQKEHYLQLAIYMYMHEKENPNVPNTYYLFNILTNEKIEITYNSKIIQMVECLIDEKFKSEEIDNDKLFLEQNKIIHDLYYD